MATGYIYNGLADTELKYGGFSWFSAKGKVLTIPDWTFREVDHAASTGGAGEAAELTYKYHTVPGTRIAEELVDKPGADNHIRGIQRFKGEPTGRMIIVHAGFPSDMPTHVRADSLPECPITGERCAQLHTEVQERLPTMEEKSLAGEAANAWKKLKVQEYLQSKREKMSGGKGRLVPDPVTRAYMNELGVEDLDDVTAKTKKDSSEDLAVALERALNTITAKRKPGRKPKEPVGVDG